ncbi:MAG: helix-turn-helix transcriptional regulator, partial [Betaproteobacteria bacterium]|nr:helix-turn-helix transcriptional regulator [Betaproteobacteria bacterium]
GEKVERSGQASSQRAAVLKAVQALPGHTSYELANRVPIDRYVLARRLPELRKAGLVRNGQQSRECQVTGNNAMTWYAL